MLDWLSHFAQKPDHPMHSIEEAGKLLADLSGDPLKALQQVTVWLTTLTKASGFRLATRVSVTKMVDEAGQPFERRLNRQYLPSRTLQETEPQRRWQAMQQFWERVAEAYLSCLDEMQRDARLLRAHRNDLPLLYVRTLRALANQMKLLHLAPPSSREKPWQPLFKVYWLSEIVKCSTQSVLAYADDALQTTAQKELLRALMLSIASAGSPAPYQVELMDRAASRFGDLFLLKTTPEPECNWYVDLALPVQPGHVSSITATSPTVRFFGAGPAFGKIEELIRYQVANPTFNPEFLGDDFSSQEKLMVFKRLARYWDKRPPHRGEPRDKTQAEIVIAHGFENVFRLLTRIDMPGFTRDKTIDFKGRSGYELIEDPTEIPTEKWRQHDASRWGISARIPPSGKSWAKTGELCALNCDGEPWGVGVVRRIFSDSQNREHAGIEILAKHPVSLWLHCVEEGTQRTDKWATSLGSYTYQDVKVILIGVSVSTPRHNELLVEPDVFALGAIYQAMVGNRAHHLKFEELIEQGTNFDRVRFSWRGGGT